MSVKTYNNNLQEAQRETVITQKVLSDISWVNDDIVKNWKDGKISQEALSELLNVSRDTVQKWISGEREPHTSQLVKMAEIFDCDIAYLAGMQREKRREYSEYGKYTGLSSDAIRTLNILSNHQKRYCEMISELIEELGGAFMLEGATATETTREKFVTDTLLGKLYETRHAARLGKDGVFGLREDMQRLKESNMSELGKIIRKFCEG